MKYNVEYDWWEEKAAERTDADWSLAKTYEPFHRWFFLRTGLRCSKTPIHFYMLDKFPWRSKYTQHAFSRISYKPDSVYSLNKLTTDARPIQTPYIHGVHKITAINSAWVWFFHFSRTKETKSRVVHRFEHITWIKRKLRKKCS